ncbi:MAG: nitrogen fixation protein NifH [Dehalococcoidia bacterium]|nr:MAG: nitrogen fixation protein NifH [Dehalococcoidia bacterium]
MDEWKKRLKGDSVSWLLEPDDDQPAVRYFALRGILKRGVDDDDVSQAKNAIMDTGPVPVILAAQNPEGFWVNPGAGYGPKYQGTVWQIVFLAQLGADGSDPRVQAGCEYALSHNIASNGALSVNGTPSAFIHCMAGNMGAALIDLGWLEDRRLQSALEWQARMITGNGVAPADTKYTNERYYKSGTTGPLFACAANGDLPCAWGGIKALLALSKVPLSYRTERMKAAIDQGVDFLLSYDPAVADYPFGYGNRPNSSWFKFGYPIGYITDVLQNLEVLTALGQAQDARLARALEMVENKQDDQGRWRLEYSYNGKTWVDIEKKGQPSKWVTLRALRVLKAAYP